MRAEEKTLLVGSSVWLYFPWFSQDDWYCSEVLLPSDEEDVLNQIQALFSTEGVTASSSPDSQPLTTANAIFVKSHLKKWLFSLPRGGLQACKSLYSSAAASNLIVQSFLGMGRRPLRGREARNLQLDGRVLKMRPMANSRQMIL
jgi:hypothetical protein